MVEAMVSEGATGDAQCLPDLRLRLYTASVRCLVQTLLFQGLNSKYLGVGLCVAPEEGANELGQRHKDDGGFNQTSTARSMI